MRDDSNSVSISFRVGGVASVVLFDHYGGPFRVIHALAYAAFREGQLEAIERPAQWPPGNVVMVDYIRHAAVEMDIVGLYLGKDERDGYNSGFGHWVIDLDGDLPAQLTQAITDLGPPLRDIGCGFVGLLGFHRERSELGDTGGPPTASGSPAGGSTMTSRFLLLSVVDGPRSSKP